MSVDFLTEEHARTLVEDFMAHEPPATPLQELLDAGEIPKLNGYIVKPGKVSDSIFGGPGSYFKKDGTEVAFENPPLETTMGTPLRLMVRTERISTHDQNRGEIPFKDQILAMNHHFMRRLVRDIIGTSQYDVPGLTDNSVVVAAENLDMFMFENVLRAYAAKSTTETSLYQAYFMRGERRFAGHQLPEGLVPNGPLPYVMDTPSTKGERDQTVPPTYLFQKGICTPDEYIAIRNASLVAFGTVRNFLRLKGMLIVDTKTEHGRTIDGEIKSQDELYTMDSSRYWLEQNYNDQLAKLARGEISELNPLSYSKEFARGFSEGDKGYLPEQRVAISVRYIMGMQHLLGVAFEPDTRSRDERVINGLKITLAELVK